MSFLTPFYIAGLLAISLPVVFHLIRRRPRGEVPFSSLMFLSSSPPQLTRRSRLDQWLLLLMRALALALLAVAFARPFLRQPVPLEPDKAIHRHTAIVVDTSASMRRGNLWQQAVAAVDRVISEARPHDRISVFASDESLRPIAGAADLAHIEPARRHAVVKDRLKQLHPTWAGTNLGQTLQQVGESLHDTRDATEEAGRASRRIVLVSDMQAGSRLDVLGEYSWPGDVELELISLSPEVSTNAGLQQLSNETEWQAASGEPPRGNEAGNGDRQPTEKLRIRVVNVAASNVDQFQVEWKDAQGEPLAEAMDVYVPAGESRVVHVAAPHAAAIPPRLELHGDAHDFDNNLFIVPQRKEQLTVGYIGTDAADDSGGHFYYLQRALSADGSRNLSVRKYSPEDPLPIRRSTTLPLFVVTAEPSQEQAQRLRRYAEWGGTLLYVVTEDSGAAGLASVMGTEQLPIEDVDVGGYTMLGEIAFDHEFFARMAGPQFNDFTQIRFWKYRRIDTSAVEGAHVLARFEQGDPAVIEQQVGRGRVIVLASGWQPSDSQLARSWKFLLMLSSLIDASRHSQAFRTQYLVNEQVRLPDRLELDERAAVTKPDGSHVPLRGDATAFAETDLPGVYTMSTGDDRWNFAVNVDPAESHTDLLPPERFEQVGCRLAGHSDRVAAAVGLQQLRDVELESRQRLWQWLIAALLVLLVVETWYAGRQSRPAEAEQAAA